VLAPANNYITWNPKEAVKLRTADSGPQAQTPVSVVTAFQQTLARFPDHVALGTYFSYLNIFLNHFICFGLQGSTEKCICVLCFIHRVPKK